MANTAAWQALTPTERAEKQKHHAQNSASLCPALFFAHAWLWSKTLGRAAGPTALHVSRQTDRSATL